MIVKQYQKYREVVLYLFFGICTTAVNTICYGLTYELISINNIVSTIIAWLAAVIFAFVTNKIFVFQSQSTNIMEQLREVVSFFGCRLATGVLDVIIMAVAVDYLGWNGLLWKLISNVIVTIINYVASKFWIFKNSDKE